MSIENELKLLPKEEIEMEKINYLIAENGYDIQEGLKSAIQEDTYYDNKEHVLRNNGCSFRIRKKGNKAYVTCKIPIKSYTTYKQRTEMELEIPDKYINENGEILIEDAIKILKEKYPSLELPAKFEKELKITNKRKKENIIARDGTKIELSFDSLTVEDKDGIQYIMNDELEGEIIEGNSSQLEYLEEILNSKYKFEKNDLSKYERANKEINHHKREDILTAYILSKVIASNEFETLKAKGQMIHDYRGLIDENNIIDIPENLKLDKFKKPEYLLTRINEIKKEKNYKPGTIKNIEDMFLCFFSDMRYEDLEANLVKFLNENYYNEDKPITNRMLHSQQVALITGLISTSKLINKKDRKNLLCMSSALLHDIGHVPGAHSTEELLRGLDGFFSHEMNGSNTVNKIVNNNKEELIENVMQYYEKNGIEYNREEIEKELIDIRTKIKDSIEAHSRTNSEKRGDGTVVQIPREADKIAYLISDIVDIIKRQNIREKFFTSIGEDYTIKQTEFFPKDWKNEVIARLGKGVKNEEINRIISEIEHNIYTRNFGRIIVDIANTITENKVDGKVYYDVDQNYWNCINEMIEYVRELRSSGIKDIGRKRNEEKIENTPARRRMQMGSMYFILKTFNEQMQNENVDGKTSIDEVWEKTIEKITNSTDIDILNCTREIKDKLNTDPKLKEAIFKEGGILDITKIGLLDNSDRQIKLQPQNKFQVADLLPYLSKQSTQERPETFVDTYYKNKSGISVCIREYPKRDTKRLIVKRDKNKAGVSQVERERFETDELRIENDYELLNVLKSKYPEIDLEIELKDINCQIETERYKIIIEDGTVISRDSSSVLTKSGKKVKIPETIEIRTGKNNIVQLKEIKKKIKEFLQEKGIKLDEVVTKKTKEEISNDILNKYNGLR